jgi:glycosyltransferase involved in cell wall biosynthesis
MEVNVSWWNVVPYDRPRMSRIRAGRLREVRSIGIPDANNIRENRVKLLTLFEMKIAQVAPLIESVPPRLYGGTERIVSYLTEELVRLGHDVTLFASGDSITSAELAPCCTRALRLDPTVRDTIPHFMLMIDKVRERAEEFDILHFHIDLFHFPLFRSLAARTLTTLHGRQDLGDLKPFYSRFGEMPLVSISNDQRKPLPHANFVATIHHGIPA